MSPQNGSTSSRTSVLEEFESGTFWSCRELDKWLLLVVTLLAGIALGADIIIDLFAMDGGDFPVDLALVGVLSIACVLLLGICVTYAAPAALVVLILSLFVEGLVMGVLLALLITGLTAQTSTKRFRRGTLAVMMAWSVALGMTFDEQLLGLLVAGSVAIALLTSYGVGGAFRRSTDASLQSQRDLEELERRHRESVAYERKSIARDLHDVVAHDITIIAMQARAAQLKGTREAYEGAVKVIGNASRTALNDMRRVLTVLNPEDSQAMTEADGELISSASELDVRRGLLQFTERLEHLGLTVDSDITGSLDGLSRSVNAALYRILQECATNAAKYAPPGTTVRLELEVGEEVCLTVTNSLVSGAQTQHWSSSGAGLIGVRDRVAAFGGSARYGVDNNGNWKIRITGLKSA
ncbi:sensor histidine kinase [Nesterenkonia sp. NBAIMH1]|uniref:sensor histidine kinase n=1 Tax=Nesterenkonia sp. NBAIMH1 TaxID=2600320 RepID=UPI0011B4E61E|nr:histidine kinase [Nesterenkonia sp. NBAIMH1]